MKVEILGIKIDNLTRVQLLEILAGRIKENVRSFIVTPYGETFHAAFSDYRFKDILNSADFAIPDGISVQWLSYFLSIPLRAKGFYPKILEAFWQMVYSGAQILLNPHKIRQFIPEKISGSDFFWDLIKLSVEKNFTVYLLGGFGDTPFIVEQKVKQRFPNARVVGVSNRAPSDPALIEEINRANPDMLLVCFGPVKQEKWIDEHWRQLSTRMAIGLGGTFDYVAGKKKSPPHMIRNIGLEWLYRLFTQPKRFKRIWNATFGLIRGAIRYKVFSSMPMRENVVGVILNNNGDALVARRITKNDSAIMPGVHWQFPQGGVDRNEPKDLAIMRELHEELGTTKFEIIGQANATHTYHWWHPTRPLWGNRLKYTGQHQTIYFLRFTGIDSDIKLDHKEFDEFKWVKLDDLKSVMHPFRHQMLDLIWIDLHKILY